MRSKALLIKALYKGRAFLAFEACKRPKKAEDTATKFFFADLLFSHGCLFNKMSRYKI